MKVLLAPHGTRGDVQPMLALAIALRARGHVVSFVAPSNFSGWIRSHGFPADSDGIDVAGPLAGLALRRPLNAGRSKLGLPPIDAPIGHLMTKCVLVAADRDLGPLGDDAIETAVATDAWILEDPRLPLDPRLDAFLDRDPPPVYIGFG